jgi:uncharacterized membrane protein
LSYAKQQIDSSLSDGELDALVWLRNNVPKNSLVVSVYSEGKLLDSISGVKSFISEDFLLVDNIDQRFEDHETIFNSVLSSNPIRLLTKYGIEYIYFSPMAANFFDIDKVAYIDDSCFSLVFDGDVKIYEVGCVL